MTTYDLTKGQKGISSGQKFISLDNSGNTAELEKRVSNIENKLDTLIALLTKEDKNDKDRLKPISGNDSGV